MFRSRPVGEIAATYAAGGLLINGQINRVFRTDDCCAISVTEESVPEAVSDNNRNRSTSVAKANQLPCYIDLI